MFAYSFTFPLSTQHTHISIGLHFTLDPSSCSKRELIFSRDLSVAKLTSPVNASVTGNVTLSNGCHYWKIRIDQFLGANNNGFVAVGVAKELKDGAPIGEITFFFLQYHQASSISICQKVYLLKEERWSIVIAG